LARQRKREWVVFGKDLFFGGTEIEIASSAAVCDGELWEESCEEGGGLNIGRTAAMWLSPHLFIGYIRLPAPNVLVPDVFVTGIFH
jgi:hypothetical protein